MAFSSALHNAAPSIFARLRALEEVADAAVVLAAHDDAYWGPDVDRLRAALAKVRP